MRYRRAISLLIAGPSAVLISLLGGTLAHAVPGPDRPLVLFLGDSLTAGFGLSVEMAFPRRLAEILEAEGLPIEAVNAGVSGDTSAGGLGRLDRLLKLRPAIVVVGLGGNDGLRGLDLSMTEDNLRQIIERSKAAGAAVLLLGMRMPPNYGDYADDFAAIYPRLAEQLGVALVPFLLAGVGGDESLNQPDGIHPNEQGHRLVAENVAPYLAFLVGSLVE